MEEFYARVHFSSRGGDYRDGKIKVGDSGYVIFTQDKQMYPPHRIQSIDYSVEK